MNMPKHPHVRVVPLLMVLILLQSSLPAFAQSTGSKISTVEQIAEDFTLVPCEDSQRFEAVKSLFANAGIPTSELAPDVYKDVENLVVIKQGASSEKVIIGAHYDKVGDGCGAIDNWTGLVTLSHLYRTLRDIPLKKTLVFVAFGKEEKGLVGSRAMASVIGKEQLVEFCAMINIDSLGLGPPQVADNMSTKKMGRLAAELAKDMEIPFGHASIGRANSDSSSFVAKKIPAVTIHGLSNDWPDILHSKNDQASKVNATSVYLGYRLALAMLLRLDGLPCDAYK